MENNYAFSIKIDGNNAEELKQEVFKAFESNGISTPVDNPWHYDGPPEGAFGFGEGLLGFLGDAWKELVKLPEAVLAVAEGFGAYLKNRPNGEIVIVKADGSSVKIKGNMDGKEIAETIKNF